MVKFQSNSYFDRILCKFVSLSLYFYIMDLGGLKTTFLNNQDCIQGLPIPNVISLSKFLRNWKNSSQIHILKEFCVHLLDYNHIFISLILESFKKVYILITAY